MNDLLILLLFVGLMALPFIPGVLFLRRRTDDKPLRVDPEYTRDPLFFGEQMRARYEQALGSAAPESQLQDNAQMAEPLLVAGETLSGAGVSLTEGYLQGGGQLGPGNRVSALVADQSLSTGPGLKVERFMDVRGDLTTAEGSNLGLSAAATGQLALAPATRFQRLYGKPVLTTGLPQTVTSELPSVGDQYLWARDALRIPKNQVLAGGIICHGTLYLGEDSTVLGDVKVYGDLHMLRGARIDGNVVVRGDIYMHSGNHIHGHVHTEKNLWVGPHSTLGREEVQLSFYVAGRTTLASGVRIYGYLVADRGGEVMAALETVQAQAVQVAQAEAEAASQ